MDYRFFESKDSKVGMFYVPSNKKINVFSIKWENLIPRVFVQVEVTPFDGMEKSLDNSLPIEMWKNYSTKKKIDNLDFLVDVESGKDKVLWSPRLEEDSVLFITGDSKKYFINLIYSQPTYFKKLYSSNLKNELYDFVSSKEYKFMIKFCLRSSLKLISMISQRLMFCIGECEDKNAIECKPLKKPCIAKPLHAITINHAEVSKDRNVFGYINCTPAKNGKFVQLFGDELYENTISKMGSSSSSSFRLTRILNVFPPTFKKRKNIFGDHRIVDMENGNYVNAKYKAVSHSKLIKVIQPPLNI